MRAMKKLNRESGRHSETPDSGLGSRARSRGGYRFMLADVHETLELDSAISEDAIMKYRKLGRTGFEVSDIAYGLWGMSGWSGSDDKESLASLQLAVDLGCNFFDTAWAYGEGKSDGLLGEIMQRNKGKRLYAASKIPPANDRWPALPEYKYSDVFSAKHVFKYADLIRKQLRVDTHRCAAISCLGRLAGPMIPSSDPQWRN